MNKSGHSRRFKKGGAKFPKDVDAKHYTVGRSSRPVSSTTAEEEAAQVRVFGHILAMTLRADVVLW